MQVDGICYDLELFSTGRTTKAYHVFVCGERVEKIEVVEHTGRGSRRCKWCILGPGVRAEATTKDELYVKLAKVIHG